MPIEKNFLDLSVEGRALGRLQCLLLAACFPKKKNFLPEELSRPFCGGTRIGTPTMPSACCVLHRRRKTFFGRCALLCLLLAACFPKKKTLFEKNFLDLSVEGCALGRL